MALQKYNARDVQFEVEDFLSPGTWVPIGGINTLSKSHEAETADTTTFASEGQAESQRRSSASAADAGGATRAPTIHAYG